ncbi:hypothetical protein M9434_004449 [Picochlorum sp. BPE23]|nr:hypothetical protein M9434_004449 [Picochlorum sp. BPE23]
MRFPGGIVRRLSARQPCVPLHFHRVGGSSSRARGSIQNRGSGQSSGIRCGSSSSPSSPSSSGGHGSTQAGSLIVSAAAALGGLMGAGLGIQMFQDKEHESPQVRKNRELAMEQQQQQEQEQKSFADVDWYEDVSGTTSYRKVLCAEDLLKQDHPFLEDDHMFSAFVARGLINDIEGFYSKDKTEFRAVVALGREVAGWPKIVHGGLTAAIFDEVFGGLLYCLKKSKAVSFLGPAYTVQLDVSYKSKIAASSTVLCTATLEKFEGRKLSMTARLSDGPDGRVYATSRALFVTPKLLKLVSEVAKYSVERLKNKLTF